MKQPTKQQVLDASKDCPEAKAVLVKLFPEVFSLDGWREIPADELEYKSESNSGGSYFSIVHKGEEIACMDYYAEENGLEYSRGVTVRINSNDTSCWKIVPNKPLDTYGNYRVFEKV